MADSRFWVVRPRIAGGEVSGLGTLLAGSYIGADPGHSKTESKRISTGLETPPVVTSDLPGRAFTLLASNLGSLDVNSPVYYRGVLAGRVVSRRKSPTTGAGQGRRLHPRALRQLREFPDALLELERRSTSRSTRTA